MRRCACFVRGWGGLLPGFVSGACRPGSGAGVVLERGLCGLLPLRSLRLRLVHHIHQTDGNAVKRSPCHTLLLPYFLPSLLKFLLHFFLSSFLSLSLSLWNDAIPRPRAPPLSLHFGPAATPWVSRPTLARAVTAARTSGACPAPWSRRGKSCTQTVRECLWGREK